MSTMPWSPLLLTLVALCTGDWMWGQGKGPGKTHRPYSLLSCQDPRVTMSVSPPARTLGPGCADSAAIHKGTMKVGDLTREVSMYSRLSTKSNRFY